MGLVIVFLLSSETRVFSMIPAPDSQDVLIDAFARLTSRYPDVDLVMGIIIGERSRTPPVWARVEGASHLAITR